MKNMKLKAAAAAIMALSASGAFATTTLTPTTYAAAGTNPAAYVNTNIPQQTFFIAGSSALGNAVKSVVTADLFDTTQPVITINDKSTDASHSHVSAWLGLAKTGPMAHSLLYVVYNNNNGSAAGLSQVLVASTTKAAIPEADVVLVGPGAVVNGFFVPATKLAGAVANTLCTTHVSTGTTDPASSVTAPIVDCTSHGILQADLGISDVNLTEVFALETASIGTAPAAAKALDNVITELPSGMHVQALAVQGFGVAVNSTLYAALQAQNINDGLLPASCAGNTDGVVAGLQTSGQYACMPTIRKADYSALVTGADANRYAADTILGPNSSGDTTAVTLARRDDYSGTQATSNIHFADNACGDTAITTKGVVGKAIAGVLGGAQNVLSAANFATAVAPASHLGTTLTVQANASTSNVVSALNSSTGYSIGVLTLNNPQAGTDTWKFVKINGVSPVHYYDAVNGIWNADPALRAAQASGMYTIASTAYAVWPNKPLAKKNIYGTNSGFSAPTDATWNAANSLIPVLVTSTFTGAMQDSTQHNLVGIGYLDNGTNGRQTKYEHAGGNNCAPMVHL
jgi:hypothetical protein